MLKKQLEMLKVVFRDCLKTLICEILRQ